MKINYQDLQKKINIKFKNLDLLIQSLTHKSFDTKKNNEKMEFLGDRVLGLVIAKKLLEITKPKTLSPRNSNFSLFLLPSKLLCVNDCVNKSKFLNLTFIFFCKS